MMVLVDVARTLSRAGPQVWRANFSLMEWQDEEAEEQNSAKFSKIPQNSAKIPQTFKNNPQISFKFR